jgi:hypothetical protein
MQITQKFYDFIVLLSSKYNYANTMSFDAIDEGEDWRLFFKKDILKYVRNIKDYDLKELCIFFTDDFLSKKTEWSEFLIEKAILRCNTGGSVFYERLDGYLENKDINMAKCYLIALKFGFTGYKKNPLENDYEFYFNKFKSYANIKTEIMLEQYEGDLKVPRTNRNLTIILFALLIISIPIMIKVYYIITTFNYLNQCYLQWGYLNGS